jgi:hypothetical protein
MNNQEINSLFVLIKETSLKFSQDTKWHLMDEEVEDKLHKIFGKTDDVYPFFFESVCLFSCQFLSSLERKFPKVFLEIHKALMKLLIEETYSSFSKYNLPINWDSLFLDRIIFYSSGELNILLENIVKRKFIKLNEELCLPQESEVVLLDNSRLYNLWYKEPLSLIPSKSINWQTTDDIYKMYDRFFLKNYYLSSISMLSKTLKIIDN